MKRTTWFILGGLLVALLLAGVVSNFASGSPDGLDSASTKGCVLNDEREIVGGDCIARNGEEHELGDSPLADYGVRGIDNAILSTGLSGVLGVLLTFAVGGGIFWLARRRGGRAPEAGTGDDQAGTGDGQAGTGDGQAGTGARGAGAGSPASGG